MLPKNVDMNLLTEVIRSGWTAAECRREAITYRMRGRLFNRGDLLSIASRFKRVAQYLERSGE